MSKNADSPTLSFDILQLINQKELEKIIGLVEKNKDVVNARFFDATTQNLLILQFFVTKNINTFLTRLEKSPISVDEVLNSSAGRNSQEDIVKSFYILYNYVYFRKLNRKHSSFADEELINFRFFKNKTQGLPCFPSLKLFFSKMNFFYNQNMKIKFINHFEEMQKLQSFEAIAKNVRISSHSFEKSVFVSVLYGSTFYHLPLIEQNNYCPIELRISALLLNALVTLFFKAHTEFTKLVNDLKESLEELRKIPTITMDHIHQTGMTVTDANPPVKLYYETVLHSKLCGHIRSCISFLECLHFIGKESKVHEFNRFVHAEFMSYGKIISKYRMPLLNLLAIANYQNDFPNVGGFILKKIILNSKLIVNSNKKGESNALQELSRSNNQILQISNHFNLALSFSFLNLQEQAIAIFLSIGNNFKYELNYWYRLGLSYYKLFLSEFEVFVKTCSSKTGQSQKNTKQKKEYKIFCFKNECFLTKFIEHLFCENKENIASETAKNLKTSSIGNSIFAFENCHLVIKKIWDEESFPNTKSKAKPKDQSTQTWKFINSINSTYLVSVLEFLAFLYIIISKPLQSLRTIASAMSIKSLSKEKLGRFFQYKLKALSMLSKPGLLSESLKEMEALKIRENGFLNYINISTDKSFKQRCSYFSMINFNTLSVYGKTNPKENFKSKLRDFLELKRSSRSKIEEEPDKIKNMLVFYHSQLVPGRKELFSILNSCGNEI